MKQKIVKGIERKVRAFQPSEIFHEIVSHGDEQRVRGKCCRRANKGEGDEKLEEVWWMNR